MPVFCSMSAFREEGRLDWLVEEASSPSPYVVCTRRIFTSFGTDNGPVLQTLDLHTDLSHNTQLIDMRLAQTS